MGEQTKNKRRCVESTDKVLYLPTYRFINDEKKTQPVRDPDKCGGIVVFIEVLQLNVIISTGALQHSVTEGRELFSEDSGFCKIRKS